MKGAGLNPGDEPALGELIPLVYAELKRLAAYYLRQERPDHTLQPTALVHEAYLRLAREKDSHWESRTHFVRVAASQMRRVLVDYSRGHNAAKRDGKAGRIYVEAAAAGLADRAVDILVVDEALTRLAELDPEQGRLVELRFFGGLSIEETAAALGISTATVKRNWSVAKAWLAREMNVRQTDA
ncbi:MAG TPA: ECF-type sigma factor [Bryobacteraceae bacterium]|jgi:RNA polymerase sigma factor (TIGR02999 family)